MRVRISYTVEVDDAFRRAINLHYGLPGLATRAEVKQWFAAHGESESDNVMYDLQIHEEAVEHLAELKGFE